MTGTPAPAWLTGLSARAAEHGSFFNGFDPPRGRESAVLMLFGPADDGGQDVVLTERAATLRKHPGQVSFPGGTVDPDDAGPVQTAMREAAEEIALSPAGVEIIGVLPPVPLSVTGFRVTPVCAWWSEPSPVRAAEAEVARVARVRLTDLLDPRNRFTAVHPSREFAAPAFEVDGLYIWGFTAIVLDATLTMAGLTNDWNTQDRRVVPSRFMRR